MSSSWIDEANVERLRGRIVPPPGGASLLQVVRTVVAYSSFTDSGGYFFAPVHSLASGDVFLFSGLTTTEDFNDSGNPTFVFADSGNVLSLQGTADPTVFADPTLGVLNMNDPHTDWTAGTMNLTDETVPGYHTGPVTYGISDNGSGMVGDGTQGQILAVLIYVPAP